MNQTHISPDALTILAIESSCDETSASVTRGGKVLSNIISSQLQHQDYGGVIPELASRLHQQQIVRVTQNALDSALVRKEELHAVAFTAGPGLIGALMVGVNFAKAFALGLNIPMIAVDHMEAHILANFLQDETPGFPFLCLTVSGGHTQLAIVRDYLQTEIIGRTRDDAAGEAFDKGAKIMGLPYPGGPLVDKLAAEGNPKAFEFPISDMPGLDFSFSGLKTSLLYLVQKGLQRDPEFVQKNLHDLCASYQATLVTTLLRNLEAATLQHGLKEIALAGGVSANRELRARLKQLADSQGWKAFFPAPVYCTDNAAMIAIMGHYKYLSGQFADLSATPYPRSLQTD